MTHSVCGASVYGSAQGVQMSARLDASTSPAVQRTWLTVHLTIDPGLHVYGQPIPEGFIPLTIDVTPRPGLVVGTPEYPPPTSHPMEGLDEACFIYEGTLAVAIPLTFTAEGHETTLEIKARYQACGEMGCFMPQTLALHLPLPVQGA